MMSFAHITHGDAVMNTTLSRTLPGALTRAFISEWMQPQLPGTAESQRLGSPRAFPLYPMASTFSSRWSVITVPTWRRVQVDRLASSSAIRMYTSNRGTRVTGGAGVPAGNRFNGCVFASTPSLQTLMDLPVGIVARVLPAGLLAGQPRVELRRHQAVGALLPLRRSDGQVIGVFVLGVPGVSLHPRPLDLVRLPRLVELLPQLEVLHRAALAAPPARLPVRDPFRDALDQVLGVRRIDDARLLPLAADPLEGRNGAGQGHPVVGGLRREVEEVPPGHAVARASLDERRVAARTGLRAVVAQAALVGVDQHGRRVPVGHVRVESRPGCRYGAGSAPRATRRRGWDGPRRHRPGPRARPRRGRRSAAA